MFSAKANIVEDNRRIESELSFNYMLPYTESLKSGWECHLERLMVWKVRTLFKEFVAGGQRSG